eukprot:11420399-Alexandrium_andersonii.AAC.1
MTDDRRQQRRGQMNEEARQGPLDERSRRCGNRMDPSFPQQVAALGLLLGRSGASADSREAACASSRAVVGGMRVEGRVEAGDRPPGARVRQQ